MRLEELYLDGFGHFFQRTFTLGSGGITVFHGPNEAGKSTLLAFIRTALFGFPSRNRDDHFAPLAGGRHGGRIKLTTDGGERHTIERYAGPRGGPVTLVDDAGMPLDASLMLPRITGQSTPAVFSNVFAFSIDELQQMGLLDDASISDAIYSAGQGVPGLAGFSRSLASRQDRIFLPTGRVQEVPNLARAIREVDEQLKAVAGNAGRYGRLTARRSEIDADLAALDMDRSRLNVKSAELRHLLEAWEDWVEFHDCSARLESLPRYAQFPVDAIPRLEAFQDGVKRTTDDLDEAGEQLRLATEAASIPIPEEALLEAAAQVEEIRRFRAGFDGSVHDLPERQSELRELETGFSSRMSDLGRPWGEGELDAFDSSLAVRDQVGTWREQLDGTEETLRQAGLRQEQENQALLERQLETREAREQLPRELPSMDEAALAEKQDALRAARGCLADYERQRQNHQNLQGQLNALATASGAAAGPAPAPLFLLGMLLVAAVALGAAGAVLGGPGLPVGIAGGMLLVAVAVFLWAKGRSGVVRDAVPVASPLRQQAADAENAMEQSRQALVAAGALLDLQDQPDGAALDSTEVRLVAIRTEIDARNTASDRVEGLLRREHSQELRAARAVESRAAATAAHQELQDRWRQWLRERHLDETLTPEGMALFLSGIETARGLLAETRRMRGRVAAIEKDIEEFRQKVEPLATANSIPLETGNHGQLASSADALISRLEAAREAQSRQQGALERQETAGRLLADRQQRQAAAWQELADFMGLGETDDPEEFRRRAGDNASRQESERRQQQLRSALERRSGPGEQFDSFLERFASTDQVLLNEESKQLADKLQATDEKRNDLMEERGRVESELDGLTGEEESSQMRVRRETLVEQLRDCAREWSRLTLARELLERTRQEFEAERQPRVVQHAQDFFARITGQRYDRLYVPMGERTVTVEEHTGARKLPSQLSRGTREQLYLALRFGLVREFGEHAERLPVVVDEVLVNFDPERARLAADCFAQLSETNQVMVFTCHPAMVDLFANMPGTQVVDVDVAG